MIGIDLIHLETLLWIEKLGTFAAAADRLNTTQPAISARIREMESRLGARLFKRQGRRMVLTVRGRSLAAQCEPLLNQLQEALLAADGFSMASGVVRLGVGEIAALSCVPAFVADIKRQMPGVSLEIDVDLTINLKQKLASGLLDLAFLVGPVNSPYLQAAPIGRVPMLWFANAAVAQEIQDRQMSPGDAFRQLSLWCLSRPSHMYEVMLSLIRQNDGSAKNINTCNHVKGLIEMVAAGAGVGILPVPLARAYIEAGQLIEIDMGAKPDSVEFLAVMSNAEEDPLLRELFARAAAIRLV